MRQRALPTGGPGQHPLQIGNQESALRQAMQALAGEPVRAVTEAVANAADEGARKIVVRVDREQGVVAIHDNGRGLDDDDARRVATSIFQSIKAERGLLTKGRFARAALLQLAVGKEVYWIGFKKGHPTIGFCMYQETLRWDEPRTIESRHVVIGKGKNRVVFTRGMSVLIRGIPRHMMVELDTDRITAAILDAFESDLYEQNYRVGVDGGDNRIKWVTPVTRGTKPVLEGVMIKTPLSLKERPNQVHLFLFPSPGRHTISVSWLGQTVVRDIRTLHPDFRELLCADCGLIGGTVQANELTPDPDKVRGFQMDPQGAFKAWRTQFLITVAGPLDKMVEPLLDQMEEKRLGTVRARVSKAALKAWPSLREAGFAILPTGFGGWKAPQRTAGGGGGGISVSGKTSATKGASVRTPGTRGGGQSIPYEEMEFSMVPGLRQHQGATSFSQYEEDLATGEQYWAVYINLEHPLYELYGRHGRSVEHIVACVVRELAYINFGNLGSRIIDAKADFAKTEFLKHLRLK